MRSYIPGASSAGLFVAALAARPRLLGHNRVRSAAGGPRCAALGSLSAAISDAAFSHAVERAVQERGYPHQLELPHFLSACGLSGDGVAFVPGAPAPEEAPLVLDVRSPCEFAKGHLPGAVNMPLFSDEERAVVGTLYKQQGPEEAVAKGVRLIEASWRGMVDALPPKAREGGRLLVYCKRGGMRSGGAAWLLSQLPLEVVTLRGGYQGFRRWVREEAFQTLDRELVVLGGRTGSGKTDVLLAMAEARRAQVHLRRERERDAVHDAVHDTSATRPRVVPKVVDLEGVAQHRGSSFGALGRPAQPSNEMYENLLALQWAGLSPQAHLGRTSAAPRPHLGRTSAAPRPRLYLPPQLHREQPRTRETGLSPPPPPAPHTPTPTGVGASLHRGRGRARGTVRRAGRAVGSHAGEI